MARISHFQRYSQRENHVTNNTLLMLRHVYQRSPQLFELCLRSLLDDESLEIGPRFEQQRRGAHSVPDCIIEQAAIHLYVEAKHGGALSEKQLRSHLDSISASKNQPGSCYLVGLVRDAAANGLGPDLKEEARSLGVQLGVSTYADLLSALKVVCESDPSLREILADYETFIGSEGLLPDQNRKMVAFLCGTSWQANVKTGVYYEPEERNAKWRQASFIGIYHSKCISHVGRFRASAIAQEQDGELKIATEEGVVSPSDEEAIRQAIALASGYYPALAQEPHRYYLVDAFHETDISKVSRGGMMGHRYFDLEGEFGVPEVDEKSTQDIADLLRGTTYS